MASIRQTNFAAGELSPLLWGRTDLPLHAKGLKTCKNFFVSKQGALVSRPGSTYVRDQRSGGTTRLIPFIGDPSYVLEFSYHVTLGGAIRFLRNGTYVQDPVAPAAFNPATNYGIDVFVTYLGTSYRSLAAGNLNKTPAGANLNVWWKADPKPLEVTHPFGVLDLAKIRFAQVGDVVTLAVPERIPYELTKISETSWTLTSVSFARPAPNVGIPDILAPVPAGGAGDPARSWRWKVTEVRRDADRGYIWESAPYDITVDSAGVALPALIACSPTSPVTVRVNSSYAAIGTDPDFIGYRVYRGRGGMFGWVGDIKYTMAASNFVDAGDAPDYAMPPPQGRNPFEVYDSTGGLLRTEYPAAVAYFQERRVFAGTTERPNTLFLSATGDYFNFDERLVPVADQPLLFELASRRRESILYAMGMGRLIVFTSNSVWSMGGEAGTALNPDSVDAHLDVEMGSKLIPPLQTGPFVLFVPPLGMSVQALAYENERQALTAVDVSAASQHLLSPKGLAMSANTSTYRWHITNPAEVVAWGYAEVPWGVVWMVRADGSLLSLTRSDLDGSWGWARHDTDGDVNDICVIREDNEDYVYLAVRRTGFVSGRQHVIERMASRLQRDDVDDDICVDCAITVTQTPSATISGLEVLNGEEVYVVSKDNPVYGPLAVSGGSITLSEAPEANDGANWTGHVGLLYTCDIETLGVMQAAGKQKTVTKVSFEVYDSTGIHAGEDLDNLTEVRSRNVAMGYGAVTPATQLVSTPINGSWNPYGRAALRQTMPLPTTVVGLAREVDVGDY